MTPLDWLLEPLSYDFMARALVTTVIAAVVCALLSCWLVLIGWSLMGDAVSHAVLPGVVIAYILGVPFAIGALVFGFLAVGADRARPRDEPREGGRRDRHRLHHSVRTRAGADLGHTQPDRPESHHLRQHPRRLPGRPRPDRGPRGDRGFVALVFKRRDLTLYAFDPTHAHAIGLSPRIPRRAAARVFSR